MKRLIFIAVLSIMSSAAFADSSSPRTIDVKICPPKTYGPQASNVVVPTELLAVSPYWQGGGGAALSVNNPNMTIEGSNLMWGSSVIGAGEFRQADSNGCVAGKVALAADISFNFNQSFSRTNKLICTNSDGVFPHPTGPCQVETLTLSLDINGRPVDKCSESAQIQNGRRISNGGGCASAI